MTELVTFYQKAYIIQECLKVTSCLGASAIFLTDIMVTTLVYAFVVS